MTERMNLNMEDLTMVNGGTVVREQGECVMGKVERKHVHNDVQVSEEWISPPGGVYYRVLYRCSQCGEEYYGQRDSSRLPVYVATSVGSYVVHWTTRRSVLLLRRVVHRTTAPHDLCFQISFQCQSDSGLVAMD